ncbi:kinetochore protein Spc24 [Aplochiton taeniatus]
MAQIHSSQNFEGPTEEIVQFIRSSKDDNLKQVREKQQAFFDRHVETKKIVTNILKDISQAEERVGQRLLDMEGQKSRAEQELKNLEQEVQRCTARNQTMDSELQFLQKQLESLKNSEQELQSLQHEVDDDTTEVIPSAIFVAQLYHKVTKIKWEHDTEPHILKGVHYGSELATPINMDTSVLSHCVVSDDLWAFVNPGW